MSDSFAIGVDLGATKIAASLVTRTGQVLATRHSATEAAAGFEAVADRMAALIEQLQAIAPGPLDGVGIGSPGQVNPRDGVVRNAVNLGWREAPVVERVRAKLNRPPLIWVQTDTKAGALGEYFFGAGRDCADFVYLAIGSGLGSGVIANGRLITGVANCASELGHLSLDPEQGRLCVCGLRGCAETIVSGPGLLQTVRELLRVQPDRSGWENQAGMTTRAVLEAARAGDEIAHAAIDRISTGLGSVMAACVGVLNPDRFVIGGGVGLAAFDLIAPGALREVQRRVLPDSHARLTLARSQLESSAVGAACLVWSDQSPAAF